MSSEKEKLLDTPAAWVQTSDITSDGERMTMRNAKDILAMESLKTGLNCTSREKAMQGVFNYGAKSQNYPARQ